MQPMLAPRVEILCERCLALQSSLFASARRKMAESISVTGATALITMLMSVLPTTGARAALVAGPRGSSS